MVKRMNNLFKTNHAVTLTEVLVVAIILAILTIIGLPIYTGVIENIRDKEAIAALKELAVAENIYYSRFNIYFPDPGSGVAEPYDAYIDVINSALGTYIIYNGEWKYCIYSYTRGSSNKVYAGRVRGPKEGKYWQIFSRDGELPGEPESFPYGWPCSPLVQPQQ